MSVSNYDQVVTGFTQALKSLAAVLEKAKTHADTHQYEFGVLLNTRLFPDMFALTRQVQLVTDFAKGAAARLGGIDPPKWEDTETTYEDLQARIRKALDFLATFKPTQFEGAESRAIELKTPSGTLSFTGQAFLLHWAIPNFYFHATTAYNLLRHNGVPIGKFDFLGKV